MAEQLVSDIVTDRAFKQMDLLQAKLEGNLAALEQNILKAKDFDRALSGARGVNDLNRAIGDLTKSESAMVGITEEATVMHKEYGNIVAVVQSRIAEMNGSSKEFTQVMLAEARARKELSASTLNEAKAREINEKAAKREADAIARKNAAEEVTQTEIIPTKIWNDEAVDTDAIDARNAALAKQQTLEAEAAGSTGVYAESQQAAQMATVANTEALNLELDALEKNIVTRAKFKDEIKALNAENKANAALLKEGEITQDQYNKSIAQNGIDITSYQKRVKELDGEIKQQTLTQAEAAKLTKDASNDYKLLSLAYNEAALKAKNYSLTLGTQHPITIAAVKDAKAMETQLKTLDDSVGQNQRSVGNYGNAFTKAFGFIRQAAYVLPGIGIAGIIGGISTAVIELVSKITLGKKALTEFGETQRIVNEVLDKGEYAKAIADVNHLTNTFKLAKEGVVSKTEALRIYNEGLGQTIGHATSLDQAEQLLVDHKQAYLQMMLQKAVATEAFSQAAKKAVEAQANSNKSAVEFASVQNKITASLFLPIGLLPGQQEKATKAAAAVIQATGTARRTEVVRENNKDAALFQTIAQQADDLAAQIAKDNGFDFFGLKSKAGPAIKDTIENFKYLQGRLIQAQKDIVATSTGDVQIEARKRQSELEIELIDKLADHEIKEKGKTRDQLTAIDNKRNGDIAKNKADTIFQIERFAIEERQTLLAQADLESDELARRQAVIDEKEIAAKQAHINAIHDIEESETANGFNQSILELDKQLSRKEITQKKYDARKLQLQAQLNIELLKLQIKYAEQQLALDLVIAQKSKDPGAVDKVRKDQATIAALKIKAQALVTDYFITSNAKAETSLDKFAKKFEKISGLALDFSKAIGDIFLASSEKEKNKIQEQIDLLDKKKEKDIEVANQTILNAQERADAITAIEQVAAVKKEALERKARAEDEKRARFEKALNIAAAIADSTLAVLRALGDKTVPYPVRVAYAIAAGAVGAAKIAALAATPIPKYKEGRQDGKAEFALVGEAGAERIEHPDGTSYIADKPTFTFLPAHAKVIPNHKLMQEKLHKAALSGVHVSAAGRLVDTSANFERALDHHASRMEQAYLKGKSTVHVTQDWKGMQVSHERLQAYEKWVNNYIRF